MTPGIILVCPGSIYNIMKYAKKEEMAAAAGSAAMGQEIGERQSKYSYQHNFTRVRSEATKAQDAPPQAVSGRVLVKEAWARWLAAFPWTHFCTLTFSKAVYNDQLALKKVKRWLRFWRASRAVFFVEDFIWSDGLHLHGLIEMPAAEDSAIRWSELLWQDWFQRNGICRISTYKPGLGAEYYVTKYVTKDIKNHDYLLWGGQKSFKNLQNLVDNELKKEFIEVKIC